MITSPDYFDISMNEMNSPLAIKWEHVANEKNKLYSPPETPSNTTEKLTTQHIYKSSPDVENVSQSKEENCLSAIEVGLDTQLQSAFVDVSTVFCRRHSHSNVRMRLFSTTFNCRRCQATFECFWSRRAMCNRCSIETQACAYCGEPRDSQDVSVSF